MATAGDITSDLARRVDDPGFLGTTKPVMMDLLSRAQQLWNLARRTILGSATLTLTPNMVLYSVTDDVDPRAGRIRRVTYEERELTPTSLMGLAQQDTNWLRRTEEQPEQFATVGRDQLVIFPGLRRTDTCTVDYDKVTDDLVNDLDTIELPQDQLLGMVALGEALLGLRMRDLRRVELNVDVLERAVKGAL